MVEKLYYSIREVAAMLDLSEPTLRFYEKEFESIHPKKTPTGIRQYTTKDIEEIRLVKHLVKEKGLTLAAAAKALRENRKGVTSGIELRQRLEAIRDELIAIKEEISK